MKKTRYSEGQIIGTIKEHEAGAQQAKKELYKEKKYRWEQEVE